jgi:hypothetical protein
MLNGGLIPASTLVGPNVRYCASSAFGYVAVRFPQLTLRYDSAVDFIGNRAPILIFFAEHSGIAKRDRR